MIYIHFDKMPEILCDFWPEFEGVNTVAEQDNGIGGKVPINELEAMDTARELGRWFATDSLFLHADMAQVRRKDIEVVR